MPRYRAAMTGNAPLVFHIRGLVSGSPRRACKFEPCGVLFLTPRHPSPDPLVKIVGQNFGQDLGYGN